MSVKSEMLGARDEFISLVRNELLGPGSEVSVPDAEHELITTFIYELINILETHMNTNDTMLLYISDHGESLGENNLYLHGTPYAIAPKEQTRIPMQLWIPDKSADSMRLNKKCIREKAKLLSFSHDNFFHSLMGLLQVRSAEYRKNLDIFSSCFTKS